MLSFLKKKLLTLSNIAGIEVRLLSGSGLAFSATLLSNKNNVVSVTAFSREESLHDILSSFPKTTPIAISISGKGVLYKKLTETISVTDPAKLVKSIFPDASPQDFYWQVDHQHVFVTRKSLIESIISDFKNKGYEVIAVTLGPWAVVSTNQIVPFIDNADSFTFNGHSFSFSDHTVDTYKFISTPNENLSTVKLGDESISEDQLVSYCTAFQQFLPKQVIINDTRIGAQKEEYLQKTLFPKLGWSILLFFLIILLANFAFFNHYHSTYQQLSYSKAQNESQLSLFKDLQTKWQEKEKFITSSNWLTTSKVSYYADRIVAAIPSNIILTSLSANPLNEKEFKEKKRFEFNTGYIYIAGQCRHSVDLNKWIKQMSDYDFIEKVDVVNYYMDQGESISMFELEIKLK